MRVMVILMAFLCLPASAQEVVTGTVYSYTRNGVRHYISKPPPPGSENARTINYSFVKVPGYDPDAKLIYKCPLADGTPFYSATPYVGCTTIGSYKLDTSARTMKFRGYRCTKDCSGHEAGYEWAAEHDIEEESDCGGNSQSFIEGCRAYVEERH